MKTAKIIIFLVISIAVSCSFTNNMKTADEVESINDIKSIRFQLQKDSLYLGTWVTFKDKFDPNIIEIFYIKDSIIRSVSYFVADHYKIYDTVFLNKPKKEYYNLFYLGKNLCFGDNPQEVPDGQYYSISEKDSIFYTFKADFTGRLYSISQKIDYPLQAMEIYKEYVTLCQKNDSNTIAIWQDWRRQLVTRLWHHDGKYWMMYFSNKNRYQEDEVYLVPNDKGTAICSKRNNKDVWGKIANKFDEKFDNYFLFTKDTSYLYQYQQGKIISKDPRWTDYDYALPIDTMFSRGFKWKYYKQPKNEL